MIRVPRSFPPLADAVAYSRNPYGASPLAALLGRHHHLYSYRGRTHVATRRGINSVGLTTAFATKHTWLVDVSPEATRLVLEIAFGVRLRGDITLSARLVSSRFSGADSVTGDTTSHVVVAPDQWSPSGDRRMVYRLQGSPLFILSVSPNVTTSREQQVQLDLKVDSTYLMGGEVYAWRTVLYEDTEQP